MKYGRQTKFTSGTMPRIVHSKTFLPLSLAKRYPTTAPHKHRRSKGRKPRKVFVVSIDIPPFGSNTFFCFIIVAQQSSPGGAAFGSDLVQRLVYARHGRELNGVKVPCTRTHGKHICSMLPEVQANGKACPPIRGDSVRSGLKEAGGHHPHAGTRRADGQESHHP